MMQAARHKLLQAVELATVFPAISLLYCIALAAWLAQLGLRPAFSAINLCLAPRPDAARQALDSALAAARLMDASGLLLMSCIMAVSMMLPLWGAPLQSIMARSIRRYSVLNGLLFAAAALLVWIAGLMVLAFAAIVARAAIWSVIPPAAVAAVLIMLAAAWRHSSKGKSSLQSCHRAYLLRAFSPGTHFDAAAAGIRHGMACFRSCWVCMVLPWFAANPMLCMLVIFAVSLRDRHAFIPGHTSSSLAIAALCLAELPLT